MFTSRLAKWLVIGVLVATVVVAGAIATGVGVVNVAAQALGPGDDGDGWFGHMRGMMGRFGGRGNDYLADELGITVEELEAAREAAQEAAIAQAVEDGDLTQEQADELLARQALHDYIDPRALMAEALGITEEELAEQPMHEWLEEKGLDFETFQEQMQAAHEDAVARAVADGVITQEQADTLLEGEFGFGGMGRGPRGGFRGRGRGGCPGMGGSFGGWNSESDTDS